MPLTFIAGRAPSVQLLSEATGPLAPPIAGEPQNCPDDPTPEQLGTELLDDPSSWLEHLSHADPHLQLVGCAGAIGPPASRSHTARSPRPVPAEGPLCETAALAVVLAAGRRPVAAGIVSRAKSALVARYRNARGGVEGSRVSAE